MPNYEQLKEINATDKNGQTKLHLAIKEGKIDAITKLLKTEGIDVNIQDNNGNTALHMAAQEGNLKVVELLRDQGADATIKNKYKKTPLEVVSFDRFTKNDYSKIEAILKVDVVSRVAASMIAGLKNNSGTKGTHTPHVTNTQVKTTSR